MESPGHTTSDYPGNQDDFSSQWYQTSTDSIPAFMRCCPMLLPGQVRLMVLEAGKWDDPIEFQLDRVSLDERPRYTALSYVWGSPKNRQKVTSNKAIVEVTINLNHALRRLRREDRDLTLWVDAVCINQSNVHERNQQVEMMRDIYAQCERVVVFLGQAGNPFLDRRQASVPTLEFYLDDRDLERTIDLWSSRRQSSRKGRKTRARPCEVDVFYFLRLMVEAASKPDPPCWFDGMIGSGLESQYLQNLFEALRAMMQARWWSRVWVIQEIVVPENVTICYGSVFAPWDMLVQAAQFYQKYRRTQLSLPHEYSCVLDDYARKVCELHGLRENWRRAQKPELTVLLNQFSGRVASEDCDKVYALLGLAMEKTRIRPNYSLSLPEVFQKVVLADIAERKTLEILIGDLSRKTREDLPSWVPDWTTACDDLASRRVECTKCYDATHACSIDLSHNPTGTLNQAHREICQAMASHYEKELSDQFQPIEKEMILSFLPQIEEYYRTFHHEWTLFQSAQGPVSIPGLHVGVVKFIGLPSFSAVDLENTLLEWLLILQKHLQKFPNPVQPYNLSNQPLWEAFLRTLCADIAFLEPRIQRISMTTERNSILNWFHNGDNSPFNKDRREHLEHSVRAAVQNLFISIHGINHAASASQELNLLPIIRCATHLRRFFITENGYIGLGPLKMEVEDHVVLLPGSRTPFILREGVPPRHHQVDINTYLCHIPGETSSFSLIGDCYTHGIMGEQYRSSSSGMFPVRSLSQESQWSCPISELLLYSWVVDYLTHEIQVTNKSWQRAMRLWHQGLYRHRDTDSMLSERRELEEMWNHMESQGLVRQDQGAPDEAKKRLRHFSDRNPAGAARRGSRKLVHLIKDLMWTKDYLLILQKHTKSMFDMTIYTIV